MSSQFSKGSPGRHMLPWFQSVPRFLYQSVSSGLRSILSELCLLAMNTGQSISISVHISYFLQKCKKGQTPDKGFALFKNDITGSELVSKLKIYSRTHKVRSGCDIVWLSHEFNELISGFYCRYHNRFA